MPSRSTASVRFVPATSWPAAAVSRFAVRASTTTTELLPNDSKVVVTKDYGRGFVDADADEIRAVEDRGEQTVEALSFARSVDRR